MTTTTDGGRQRYVLNHFVRVDGFPFIRYEEDVVRGADTYAVVGAVYCYIVFMVLLCALVS